MEWLSRHPTIVANARIANVFQQDPVKLLEDGGDEFLTMIRSASMLVVQRDDKEREAQAKRR